MDVNVRQLAATAENEEEVTELLRQLQESRSQRTREQKKMAELGQQLTALVQENNALEEQLSVWRSKAQDVKNLQEEINALEEVRYASLGTLLYFCLKVSPSEFQFPSLETFTGADNSGARDEDVRLLRVNFISNKHQLRRISYFSRAGRRL